MTDFVCFMLEPTERSQLELRATHIVGNRYHAAVEVLGECDREPSSEVALAPGFEDHPRWPKSCAECGYLFSKDDKRYVDRPHVWKRVDTGELMTLDGAPYGAMWLADWYPEPHRGPDGLTLIVKTPGGHWMVDQKARDGSGWTRSGTPPNVTANPSILFHPHFYEGDPAAHGGYHGWLRDGRLVEC